VFKLFDRYVLKEIIPPFFIGLLVYTFVLLMNQILLLSEMFIARGVSFKSIVALLVYLIPSILAFTVPMSVLMGILAGLGRMSSDAEITALKTLGIGHKRLLKPILVFSFCGWVVTSVLALYLAPHANQKWVQTLSRSVLANVQFRINPRSFNETIPNTVLYVQDIVQRTDWSHVFVYFSRPAGEPRVVLAKKGRLNFFPQEKRAALELFDGAVHSYPLKDPDKYRVTYFEHLEEELEMEGFFPRISDQKRVREKDINELIRDSRVLEKDLGKTGSDERGAITYRLQIRRLDAHRVEIHKKFALPFACFIFALLGLPLGSFTRRGGRTSGFTISIGIILIYYVLITAGEQLAMKGMISPFFGIWAANILCGLGGLLFFVISLKESSPLSFLSVITRKPRDYAGKKQRMLSRRVPRISLRFPNILDRYIIRKFLFIFVLVFISMLCVFVIITFFERIDHIYEHDKPLSFLFEFIWYSLPEFMRYILPVTGLTATLLCLGLLTKSNEITAMKACGISLYRIILPVLILAALISFFSFYIQENILPYSNRKAEEVWNRINDVPPRSYSYLDRRWVMNRDKNKIYYYRYFDPIASSFSQISVYDIDVDSWALERRISAERGRIEEDRMALADVWVREFVAKMPVGYEKKKSMALPFPEGKSYFLKERKEHDQMNYRELKAYIDDIEEKGFETVKFKVHLNFKITFPLASFIMALLGIPFAFSMGKRGNLVGIGLSVVIAIIYYVAAVMIFRPFGEAGYLSPFLAAWGPTLIFGLAGVYMIFTLRT
jgi:LPS export ABC transporter permease LptF/LPS export ABC transporter permease LptG